MIKKWRQAWDNFAGASAFAVGLPVFLVVIILASMESRAPGMFSEPVLKDRHVALVYEQLKGLDASQARAMFESKEIPASKATGADGVIQTKLSEDYFVFSGQAAGNSVLYFTSRHVVDLACRGARGESIGRAGYEGVSGGFYKYAKGHALRVPESSGGPYSFSCIQKSSGPAKISVMELGFKEAEALSEAHAVKNAALSGALGLLIVFMLLTGLVNKDWRYLLVSCWLLMALRTAQVNMSTDTVFLGIELAPEWMSRLRMLAIAVYAGLLFPLVDSLLSQQERSLSRKWVTSWTFISSIALGGLVFAGALFPFQWFLPLLWVVVINTVLNLGARFGFLMACKATRTENVFWLAAGLAIPMFSWVSEVVAAAMNFDNAMRWLNNESAAVLSALLVTMAFAQQLKSERIEKTRAKEDLKRSYDTSPMGLFEASESGQLAHGNSALAAMLSKPSPMGWSMAEALDAVQWSALVEAVKASKEPVNRTIEATSAGGAPRYFDARVMLNAQGNVEGSLQDATERVKHKQRLEFLSHHDPLTECLNLRGLERMLDQVDANKGEGGMVAYFDLDRFKLVNDVYGHEAGDAVLREVKTRLARALGPGVDLGRVGGDEFLALFHGMGIDQAQTLCEAALVRVSEQPYMRGAQSFRLSASAGLVEASAVGAETARALIGAADSACRMAKSQGRDQLVAYGRDSMFYERRLESYNIAKMLEDNEALDGLYLLAQPIMALEAPFESLNFEVLLRLRLPDGRQVGAGPLIETAEAHGQIAKLDYWVLATMLDWIREHREQLSRTRFICVNLSGGSINDESFLDKVFELLQSRRQDASLLCVEITESVALRDLENTRMFVERARSIGVRVALDDFGAGYSSFGYLKDLPADALKIDGALVRDGMKNPASQSILVALAGLSTALGMRSIGEWTEDAEMVKMLAVAGFDYAQGYAIAKPMALEELIQAKSCADLIHDPETASFARLLQNGGVASLEADMDNRWLH